MKKVDFWIAATAFVIAVLSLILSIHRFILG